MSVISASGVTESRSRSCSRQCSSGSRTPCFLVLLSAGERRVVSSRAGLKSGPIREVLQAGGEHGFHEAVSGRHEKAVSRGTRLPANSSQRGVLPEGSRPSKIPANSPSRAMAGTVQVYGSFFQSKQRMLLAARRSRAFPLRIRLEDSFAWPRSRVLAASKPSRISSQPTTLRITALTGSSSSRAPDVHWMPLPASRNSRSPTSTLSVGAQAAARVRWTVWKRRLK